MRAIGNLLWFIFGGLVMGLAWWLVGLIALLTIVGIPWAKAAFVMGQFSFFPFGKEAISRQELHQQEDIGTGALGMLGNVIWFVFAGVWLAIGHLTSALACFLTIIGIPFAIQHLKLAGIALAPIGKTIVTTELADAARATQASAVAQWHSFAAMLRRFLSKNLPSCLSFRPSSVLRQQLHSSTMRLLSRLEADRKSGAIWYVLFRQSP
jgi:uncharacterized membrane protein YccF (DUF307 family)